MIWLAAIALLLLAVRQSALERAHTRALRTERERFEALIDSHRFPNVHRLAGAHGGRGDPGTPHGRVSETGVWGRRR